MVDLGQDPGQVELRPCDEVRDSEGPGEERDPSTPQRNHLADVKWGSPV